jgi:hypothetical protein
MDNPTDKLFYHTRESAQKFEYYLLGVTVVVLGYEGKMIIPERLGANSYTIEIIGIFILVLSVVAGFRHIESMIATSSLNHEILSRESKRARLAKGKFAYENFTGKELTIEEKERALFELRNQVDRLTPALEGWIVSSYRWNRVRMWLLLAGFVALLAAKILKPYLT